MEDIDYASNLSRPREHYELLVEMCHEICSSPFEWKSVQSQAPVRSGSMRKARCGIEVRPCTIYTYLSERFACNLTGTRKSENKQMSFGSGRLNEQIALPHSN